MLIRDSEIVICSRFVNCDLVIWTQPSGPLCLWQCFYFDLFECFPTSLFLAISTVFPFFKVPTLTEETLLAGSLVLPATNVDTKEHTNEAYIQTNINYTPCSRLCGLDRVGEWPGSALFWALLLLRNMIRQLTIGARKQILQITSILYRFIYGCDWLNEGPRSNHVIGYFSWPDLCAGTNLPIWDNFFCLDLISKVVFILEHVIIWNWCRGHKSGGLWPSPTHRWILSKDYLPTRIL